MEPSNHNKNGATPKSQTSRKLIQYIMKWYLKALGKYFVFSGRARRKEFWLYVLFTFIFYVVVLAVEDLIDSESFFEKLGFDGHILPAINIFTIYFHIILIPSLAVSVRRLHDIGKSGWIALILIIPVVNFLVIYYMCIPGFKGENEYGLDPKAIAT